MVDKSSWYAQEFNYREELGTTTLNLIPTATLITEESTTIGATKDQNLQQ